MCDYSTEIRRKFKVLEFKYFTIELECGEENKFITYCYDLSTLYICLTPELL